MINPYWLSLKKRISMKKLLQLLLNSPKAYATNVASTGTKELIVKKNLTTTTISINGQVAATLNQLNAIIAESLVMLRMIVTN
jgi:hypothetical protein